MCVSRGRGYSKGRRANFPLGTGVETREDISDTRHDRAVPILHVFLEV